MPQPATIAAIEAIREHLEEHQPAAVELLRRMVGINSETTNPAGIARLADLTAEAFVPLGFLGETVPSENPEYGEHLVLTKQGTGPHAIALVSHLDTVFSVDEEHKNGFHWKVMGDRAYGPGTVDIKGGTVMIWLVLQALRDLHPAEFAATTWRVFLNSSEERNSPDFGALCRERCGPETLAVLVFEAEGRRDGQPLVVTARKGRATWRVTVSGRGAHAGSEAPRGANAIQQLALLIPRITALNDPRRALTVNVSNVSGGAALNRVPHEARAEGEFRAFDSGVYDETRAALMAMAGTGEVVSEVGGFACKIDVEILTESGGWPPNEASQRLAGIWQRNAALLGTNLGEQHRGGLSDGNQLWDYLPTLDGLGPYGEFAHCSEWSEDGSKVPEYVDLSHFVPKATLNVLAILDLLRD